MASSTNETPVTAEVTIGHSKTFNLVYFFATLLQIAGCFLAFVSPLHTLDLTNVSSTRNYYWNRVEAGGQTYYYFDGVDYQTHVCYCGGVMLLSLMIASLVSSFISLVFYLTERTPWSCRPNDSTKYEATFSAFAAITYIVSIVNWGTSCLHLTRVNNESSNKGQSVSGTVFTIIIVFGACGLAASYMAWKRHQQSRKTSA